MPGISEGIERPPQITKKEHTMEKIIKTAAKVDGKDKEISLEVFSVKIKSIHPDLTDYLARLIIGQIQAHQGFLGDRQDKCVKLHLEGNDETGSSYVKLEEKKPEKPREHDQAPEPKGDVTHSSDPAAKQA